MAKTSDPPPSLDDLKARLLAGDDTVTAEQLAHAAEVQQWEDLRRQAAELKAAEEAEATRQDRIRGIGDRLTAAFDDGGDAADLDLIREAVASIARRATRRQEAFREAFGALGSEGVHADEFEPTAGITRHNAGMGLSERIIIDGRTVTYVAPGRTVADAIASGLADAGKVRGYLTPGVVVAGAPKRRQETSEQAKRRADLIAQARAHIAEQEARNG